MIIYASDLDRTLIYSKTFIDMHPVDDELVLVDESKVNSYMAKSVANGLADIVHNNVAQFIPVTTRSIEEYKRIHFPDAVGQTEYAIVASGGVILKNGEILKEFEEYLKSIKEVNDEEFTQIIEEFKAFESINYNSKVVDNSFVFSKSSNIHATEDEIKSNQLRYKHPHFRFLLDKHKVYAIPNHIKKSIAIDWLKQYLNGDVVVASGDSAFDIPLLDSGDVKIVPSHAYIKDSDLNGMRVIKISGEVLSPLKTFQIINSTIS